MQSCDNGRDKGRLSIGKEGDGGNQGPTVEVDHVLVMAIMKIMVVMMIMMIKMIMMTIVYTQSPKVVLSLLKNSLITRDQNMHRRECLKSDKLRTYNTLFDPFVPHDSVIAYTRQCLPFILRKRLSQLRLGCLPIRIETDRFTRPIVHRDLRYCLQPKCKNVVNNLDDNQKHVEDEFHFLVVCSQYDNLRSVLFSKIESPSFPSMSDKNKFVYLLTTPSVSKIVAQFIVDAFDERPVKM